MCRFAKSFCKFDFASQSHLDWQKSWFLPNLEVISTDHTHTCTSVKKPHFAQKPQRAKYAKNSTLNSTKICLYLVPFKFLFKIQWLNVLLKIALYLDFYPILAPQAARYYRNKVTNFWWNIKSTFKVQNKNCNLGGKITFHEVKTKGSKGHSTSEDNQSTVQLWK